MAQHLYPGIDFRTAVELRAFQSVGLAFLFVPINTLIYAGIPPEKNNDVSGIVNLARNMGGDIGIAFVTTMVARRAQFHQARLTEHTTPLRSPVRRHARRGRRARSSTPACRRPPRRTARWRSLYRQTILQATTLAYLDVLRVFALMTALMIPFLWLARRSAACGSRATGNESSLTYVFLGRTAAIAVF